jgi:transposase
MSSALAEAPEGSAVLSEGSHNTIYVGMDVHKDSITIAVLPEGAKGPTRVERLSSDYSKLKKFLDRLARDGNLKCCYEASGAGYVLHRAMREWGYDCAVIAPSLIPKRPGVQRKHDRRDAVELARLYRAGELTAIRIPSEAEERVRDLVRCRETFQKELHKSRHYVLKFLARRGFVFRDGKNWTKKHFEWLRKLSAASPLASEDQLVFAEYLSLLDYKLTRRDELDRRIEELALSPFLKTSVSYLEGFRGIALHSAMVLATEIVDWRRFQRATQLYAYLGFVPREDSSGSRERRGSITKAGNSHCRHVLVQAAWSYRHRPARSEEFKRRQEGLPPAIAALSWKAQQRLYKRYHHLASRKSPQVAAVAVARELAGFLWAAMQQVPEAKASMGNEIAA